MAEKSFLVQRFAKLALGQYHVIGYSVAGEETVAQIPELNVCFDIGRCPHFALSRATSSASATATWTTWPGCLTTCRSGTSRDEAGHDPAAAGTGAAGRRDAPLLARRRAPGGRLTSSCRCRPARCSRCGDFGIRAHATHHGAVSLAYSLISIREKLKAEFTGHSGPELAALRKAGTEIQYRLEVPLVTFLGDTAAGVVFEQPDVQNAEILITECTFFDPEHRTKAKAGRHLHVEQFAQLLPKLKNQHIVVGHVSRRTGIRRARNLMRKLVGDDQMKNIHFLMDFENATDAGEVEDAGPPPAETAE